MHFLKKRPSVVIMMEIRNKYLTIILICLSTIFQAQKIQARPTSSQDWGQLRAMKIQQSLSKCPQLADPDTIYEFVNEGCCSVDPCLGNDFETKMFKLFQQDICEQYKDSLSRHLYRLLINHRSELTKLNVTMKPETRKKLQEISDEQGHVEYSLALPANDDY